LRLPSFVIAAGLLAFPAAFARALEANLFLERTRRDVPIAEAQERAAFSSILPKVSLVASGILNSKEVAFGDPPGLLILPKEDWKTGIVATQPLFAGLREKRAWDQAKIAIEIARQGSRSAAEETLFAVAVAYAGALGRQAIVEVEVKNLALVKERRKQANDLFGAGETTRVDVLRAEADLKAAEDRLVSARQAVAESLADLRVLLVLDGPIAVAEPDAPLPPLPPEAELVERAIASRPDLKQLEKSLETAVLEVKKRKGAYLPVLYAEGGYVKQKVSFPTQEYGYGALRFSFDVFNGGETRSKVVIAGLQQEQASLKLEELRRRVREEVKVRLMAVEAARIRVSLSTERLAASQAEYDQALEQYRNQILTSIDLQSAEASLTDALRARISARLGLFLSEVQAWHASGSLLQAVHKEIVR
jgi:outer membrane protein TolC